MAKTKTKTIDQKSENFSETLELETGFGPFLPVEVFPRQAYLKEGSVKVIPEIRVSAIFIQVEKF